MPKHSSATHRHHDLISGDDYFLKSDNFRLWLKQHKGKYFDQLSGEKARHYFDKFVKAWNRGELSSEIYDPPRSSQRASAQTAYKWSFASKLGIAEDQKGTSADAKALEAARESVTSATAGASGPKMSQGTADVVSTRRTVPIGPSLPSGIGPTTSSSYSSKRNRHDDESDPSFQTEADRQFAREAQAEQLALSRATRNPVDKSEGQVYLGKEKQIENRRLKREENRAFREARETGGMDEVREDTLMGSGARDSFAAAVASRDAARARAVARRTDASSTSANGQSAYERRQAILDKDRQTMDMFKAMAKERFGGE